MQSCDPRSGTKAPLHDSRPSTELSNRLRSFLRLSCLAEFKIFRIDAFFNIFPFFINILDFNSSKTKLFKGIDANKIAISILLFVSICIEEREEKIFFLNKKEC